MIQNVLHQKLRPLIEAEKTLRRRRVLTTILTLGALAAVALLAAAFYADWWNWTAVLVTFFATGIAAIIGVWWAESRTIDLKTLATRIENAHPDLQAALLTAVEQRPDAQGRLGYLQERVVYDAVDHALLHNWVRRVSRARLVGAAWLQFLAMIGFGTALWFLVGEAPSAADRIAQEKPVTPDAPPPPPIAYEIEVLPGDTEVERGSRLIIEAKFGQRIPPGASLVIREPGEEGAERGRIPMKAGLDETVFSGLIAKMDADAVYRIEFDGEKSDEFNIATYVHPDLEQADAEITPPAYANQETKTIENVKKVSVLEGSTLGWTMKVNKPVVAAELFGEDESVIALTPSPEDPTVLVASHEPKETQKYRLHLVDDKDRTNQRPPWFTVTVMRNLPPKLDFTFPKRDVDVSALQELPVEAKLWDDIGILRAGATLVHGEKTREIALIDAALTGKESHPVKTLFSMEELGAQPKDLIAYHLWAEDIGPDGKPRRTESDMFFAEVRNFEDIFREQESPGGQPGQPQEGGAAEKLLKLQKDVMNATWKLVRQTEMGKKFEEVESDIGVVKESQEIAIGQARDAADEAEDAELKALFTAAGAHMGQAVETLGRSIESKDSKLLRPAHENERKAYETLIRARSQEHNVTRSQQQQSSGQSQSQEAQLMQLEMKQKELKYEEEREAQDPQEKAKQEENLSVLNRLKELAKRQEAIAKKIKELENALQEAKTDEEKQELENQLKRLQQEQEQLLRDLDDLTERMDSEENRPNMAEEREKLEETREDVKETAEKLDEGKLADAANAATRAERQLDEVKEEFRKKTSRKFEDEMREIRNRARELAENQEEIGKKYEEKPGPEGETPLANAELARELDAQRQQLGELLEQMRQVSENAEESEPILSTAMYEAVRDARMGGIEDSLEEAHDLTRYNRRELAQESERAAARGIEDLKANVEKAAEKVLGSEADALRLARSELENLIEQSREEAERLAGEQGQPGEKKPEGTELAMNEAGQKKPGDPTQEGQVGDPTGSDQKPGEAPGDAASEKGKGEQPGEKPGEGKGDQPSDSEAQKGQGKGKGEKPGEGEGEGKEPGEGQGPGQDPKMAENGKGKGQPKGEQPGQGEPPGKGEGEGEGEGQGEGKGQQPGQQRASTEGKGEQPGQGEGEGKGEGQQPGEGKGQGEGQGKGEGQGQGQPRGYKGGLAGEDQPPSPSPSSPGSSGGQPSGPGGSNSRSGMGGPNNGGGEDQRERGGLPAGIAQAGQQEPLFFQGADETEPEGPITGGDFENWADRLRNVENMLEQEDLRNEVAKVMDNARAMRIEFRRNNQPPQADSLDQRITNPLLEIRNRVAEELAKLDKENPLAPIDRDPVPREYRELVRRYYEELGSGR